MNRWEHVDKIIGQVEQILLVLLLSWMILVAFSQIVLRNIFGTGLTWGDPLVRILVLWVGFIGAAMATQERKHIQIDWTSRWRGAKKRMAADLVTDGFSCFICGSLTFAAITFIRNEIQMRNVLFLGIPSWVSEIILPMTLGLMALRFGFHFLRTLSKILGPGRAHGHEG